MRRFRPQIESRSRRRDAEIAEEQAELARQTEADRREVERLQQELTRSQFNVRDFNQVRTSGVIRRWWEVWVGLPFVDDREFKTRFLPGEFNPPH